MPIVRGHGRSGRFGHAVSFGRGSHAHRRLDDGNGDTASVERTRALLAQAKEIGEIVVVEAELAERESALEQLQGQRRVLDASVVLATITVSLEHDTEPLVVAGDDEADGWPGPLGALATGARSVLTVLNVLKIGLARALPRPRSPPGSAT